MDMDNSVLTAIRERRSTVRFKPAEVDDDKIQKILDAGRWAPSFANIQPWEFIVVTDPDLKSQLSQIGVRITLFSKGINEASAVIVVVVDPEKDPYHYIEDGSVATQNMALAAHSLGLSTYWIGLFNLQKTRDTAEETVKKILDIPDKLRVIALLPIGAAAYPETSDRKRLIDIVHYDKYEKE